MDREKLRRRLLVIFTGELDGHIQTLRRGLRSLKGDGDDALRETLEEMRRAAHSTKGAARSAGIPLLEETGRHLEQLLRGLCSRVEAPDDRAAQLIEQSVATLESAHGQLVEGREVELPGLSELLHSLDAATGSGEPAAPTSSAQTQDESARGTAAGRILVVDDSETNRKLTEMVLQEAGFEVGSAGGGEEALAMMRSTPFDLVLADVDMPGTSGIDLASTAHRDSELSRVPVVLLSGYESDEQRRQGLEAGAALYLSKSAADSNTLIRSLRGLLRR